MKAESVRRVLDSTRPPSLAKLYRDFGNDWEIEPVPPGAKWIAVLRESGGDYVRIVTAHDVDALRLRIGYAQREEPEEREPGPQ
jgi:hypothetical protein